jgi:TolB-like protein
MTFAATGPLVPVAARRGLAVTALVAALLLPALCGAQGKPAPAKAPPTVALLYFEYTGKSADLEQLRKGWARMLISDLSQSPAFQIVERDRLEEVLAELKLAQTKRVDAATAAKVGKLLGARYLVLGGYFDLKDALRVDARIVEVESGKVLKSIGAQRKADEFLELEQKLAGDLAEALAAIAGAAPPAPPPAVKPPAPKPAKARPAAPKRLKAAIAARYGKALDAKDRGNKKLARAELKKVVQAQPDFELAAADLADLAK